MLRRDLGPGHGELLRADRDVVALDPGLLDHDAHSFLASVALGTTQGLQAAADLYRGPFLDGFFAGEGEFENWARAERKRFLSLAIEALHELARRAGPEGGGLVHGKRLLSLEPTREATYRLLMALNAAAGHKALQLYAACRDMMSRVYGVEPSAETAATRARIAMGAGFAMPRANDSPPVPSEAAASVERMPTVRVLNFVNLTGGDDPDGLPRGLADEIIAALLRQRGIVVLPERSPGASGGTPPPNGDARYILSGSVQTVANRIRVNAQLIDVALGTHLWAERYDGQVEDPLGFQDRAAGSIALATWHELLLTSWKLHDRAPADAPEMRLLVQRAMVKYFEFTRESLAGAAELAEQALQLDPDSPRAPARCRCASPRASRRRASRWSREATARAVRLAERAVGLVPEDEYARCILSWDLANVGRSADAVAELEHAIALNPDYPTSHSDLAEQYAILGRSEEAIAAAQEAIRLGASGPIDFWRRYAMAVAHFAAGDYAKALDNARKVMRTKPGLLRGALVLAACAAATGEPADAAAAVALCRELVPDLRLGDVAPGVLPRYVWDEHHERFLAMLRNARLPE